MVAKFLICALFCLALTQVQGENLQYTVKRALFRLRTTASSTERQVAGTVKDVNYKKNSLQEKSAMFLERETRLEDELTRSLERIAAEAERRATVADRPPSTFECIRRAKNEALARIEAFGPKFETDLRRLERTKTASMETTSKSLVDIEASLETRYERGVKDIKNCKTVGCVNQVSERLRREYDLLFAELRRIRTQVGTAFGQYSRDASLMFSNISRQENRAMGEGAQAIKRCVTRRDFGDFSEENLSEENISENLSGDFSEEVAEE